VRLPRTQKFDQLNGQEVKEILIDRLERVLEQSPHLQRHLTLPNVRIEMLLQVSLTMHADQQGATPVVLEDEFVVDASPGPADSGHKPPDRVRHEAGLPIPVAVRTDAGIIVDDPGRARDRQAEQQEAARLDEPEADDPDELLDELAADEAGFNVVRDTSGKGGIDPASGVGIQRHSTTIIQDRGGPGSQGHAPSPSPKHFSGRKR
jgi:hypothetical protein